MDQHLNIGKMAKLNQVSTQTLRYYDKIGLLKPAVTDEKTGYRYYHINQSARLDMIQYMKCLGMPLEAIKSQFDDKDIKSFDTMLNQQEKWIASKITELEEMRRAVAQYRDNISRYQDAPDPGVIRLEHLPERRIFSYDTGINFYENDIDTWERMIRKLKGEAKVKHLPMVKFCNVGSILRKSNLDRSKFHSTEAFIFVDNPEETTEILPEGDYLTVHFSDFYREMDYAKQLLQYAEDHGYEVIGDYICEVVVELPIFEDQRNMFIKVQIPVSYKKFAKFAKIP